MPPSISVFCKICSTQVCPQLVPVWKIWEESTPSPLAVKYNWSSLERSLTSVYLIKYEVQFFISSSSTSYLLLFWYIILILHILAGIKWNFSHSTLFSPFPSLSGGPSLQHCWLFQPFLSFSPLSTAWVGLFPSQILSNYLPRLFPSFAELHMNKKKFWIL